MKARTTFSNAFSFGKTNIQLGFVTKVYSILFVQIMFTCLLCILPVYSFELKVFMINNSGMILVSLVGYLAAYFTLLYSSSWGKTYPTNYILLGLATFF